MKVRFLWHTYRYLPYEYELARRELETLFGQMPIEELEGLSLSLSDGWEPTALRTTYFREVIAENGRRVVPVQAQLEASTQSELQLALPFEPVAPLLRRQSTRYSAHGVHEYRGKFHPQIVRTIGNMLGLQEGMWILDPFCGSGTTLLESAHNGWNAVGVDINPLGVLIAQAKLAAVNMPMNELNVLTEAIGDILRKRATTVSYTTAFSPQQTTVLAGQDWQSHLTNIEYLCSWFMESVLVQISLILQAIAEFKSTDFQTICQVVLSDILREVSLQDPEDLRIRRRRTAPENAPVIPLFLEGLAAKIETVSKARPFIPVREVVGQTLLGDIRTGLTFVRAHHPNLLFDAAITSPPYVNALPYIDTQRLSLAVLGLIDSAAIKTTEKSLIGNREISNKERLLLEEDMLRNVDNLPPGCIALCLTLYRAIDRSQDGFRRQNVPALTYQYCRDMALMFSQVASMLRSRARFVIVVGPNKTVLGGTEFVLNTPELLVELAEQHGFILQETLALNTYHRYDVHQANSIRSEAMLILQKP